MRTESKDLRLPLVIDAPAYFRRDDDSASVGIPYTYSATHSDVILNTVKDLQLFLRNSHGHYFRLGDNSRIDDYQDHRTDDFSASSAANSELENS